ncbi:MAG: hypothetical protein Q9170_002044 [Blastenia crenularia]
MASNGSANKNTPTGHSNAKPTRYLPPLDLDDPLDATPPPYTEQDKIWDTARQTLPEKPPAQPITIAVMGPTGTGKSTFISKLAGQEEVPCKIGDRYVRLVDTPGFNDTNRTDTEILSALADWMKVSYSENMLLSGIIYLHSISDTRMTHSSLQNLRMFRKLCGDDNLKNVMLATTKWSITPLNDALNRERELTSEDGFWSTMISAGSVVRRFSNTAASAKELVDEIIDGGQQFVPTIQKEVVLQGKKLADTEAGAYIEEAIVRLQKKHDEEKKALLEEVQRAKQEHNLSMQKALEKERLRLDKKMAEREEEQRQLNMTTNEALQLRIRRLEEEQVKSLLERAEEQRRLQKTTAEAFQRHMQEIEAIKKSDARMTPKVKLGFWRLTWRCLACKAKAPDQGVWNCPECNFMQQNVY